MMRERLTTQLLAGPRAPDPVAVTERLLAVQAQDARGARLAQETWLSRNAGVTPITRANMYFGVRFCVFLVGAKRL